MSQVFKEVMSFVGQEKASEQLSGREKMVRTETGKGQLANSPLSSTKGKV